MLTQNQVGNHFLVLVRLVNCEYAGANPVDLKPGVVHTDPVEVLVPGTRQLAAPLGSQGLLGGFGPRGLTACLPGKRKTQSNPTSLHTHLVGKDFLCVVMLPFRSPSGSDTRRFDLPGRQGLSENQSINAVRVIAGDRSRHKIEPALVKRNRILIVDSCLQDDAAAAIGPHPFLGSIKQSGSQAMPPEL